MNRSINYIFRLNLYTYMYKETRQIDHFRYYSHFRCDDGWQGLNCSEPMSPLPTYIYDSFDPGVNDSQWFKIVGAQTVPPCKVMAAGNALHFSGVGLF